MKPFILKLADGVSPVIDEDGASLTSTSMYTLTVNDSWTEIVEVAEFIDTACTWEFMKKLVAYTPVQSGQK